MEKLTWSRVPMEKALSPRECKIMRRFLTHLMYAKKINPELNVARFMKEYRRIINGYTRKVTAS